MQKQNKRVPLKLISQMMEKKGQVTMFVIFAIIILVFKIFKHFLIRKNLIEN